MTGFESFQFLRPGWLVLIIPGFWLVFRLYQRWKQRTDWSGVVEPHLLELLLVEARGIRRIWIHWMLSLMLILVLTAMAGPVLEKRSVPVLKKNLAKVLVLDVSHSMLAEDLRPNRIERAKFKLRDLLNRIDEGETALIAYAGDAHIISLSRRTPIRSSRCFLGLNRTSCPTVVQGRIVQWNLQLNCSMVIRPIPVK